MAGNLCSWEEAVALLRELRVKPKIVNVTLEQAIGRRLAASVLAVSDYPRFRSSAMDGWALRAEDLQAGRQELIIAGRILAGDAPIGFGTGETVAVMTGAPLPPEAAGVVPAEYVTEQDGKLMWDTLAVSGHIRAQGEDFGTSQLLLEADTLLTATGAMLLASAGVKQCTVYEKPQVAVLKSGDEVSSEPGPYGIFDGTSACLKALIESSGGQLVSEVFMPDDLNKTIQAVENNVSNKIDIIITTGGVSQGVVDFIPKAVEALGGQIHLHRLAIKPAKPLLVATFPSGTILLGLPGNPVSQLVAFAIAALPLLQGRASLEITPTKARLTGDAKAKGPLLTFLRAQAAVEDCVFTARVLSGQESHRVSNLAEANAWVLAHGPLSHGDTVDVLPFPAMKVFS